MLKIGRCETYFLTINLISIVMGVLGVDIVTCCEPELILCVDIEINFTN